MSWNINTIKDYLTRAEQVEEAKEADLITDEQKDEYITALTNHINDEFSKIKA